MSPFIIHQTHYLPHTLTNILVVSRLFFSPAVFWPPDANEPKRFVKKLTMITSMDLNLVELLLGLATRWSFVQNVAHCNF